MEAGIQKVATCAGVWQGGSSYSLIQLNNAFVEMCIIDLHSAFQKFSRWTCSQTSENIYILSKLLPLLFFFSFKFKAWLEVLGSLIEFWAFIAVAWVQSLVRELRSCKPCGVATPQKNQGLVTRKSVIQIHNLYMLIPKIHLHVFMTYKFITFT